MSAPLQGIFTPNMVPLDANGEIHEAELRRYIDWLIDHGVHGLYPNGSTGEFTRFTPEERQRVIKIVCDQTRGRVPILAGAAEANVRETIRACEIYHEYGARAVAIVSPFYYKLSPDSVYAYFREIALHSPIDVTLYNIPMFASPIDVPTIRRLAEFDRVIGIKDSSGDISFMMRMKEMSPDESLIPITCFDLSPEMMVRGRQRMKSTRPTYLAADLTHLPFADETFDTVTCGYVLEHLPDPRTGLAELSRVMKPGGRMLLLTTEDSFSGAWTSYFWYCRTYNRPELLKTCEEIGLQLRNELWFTRMHQMLKAGGICVELVKG